MASREEGDAAPPCRTCASCGGRCEERHITLSLPRSASGLAVFRNVPADVCLACGEPNFTVGTTARLMAVVRSDEPPGEVAMVPIYDMGAL
ncbi:MAG: hypothetical protein IT208_12400 [Chthonomonadales bacterium]|nr:hypothetical protein [Chthonomonadales bacterium]